MFTRLFSAQALPSFHGVGLNDDVGPLGALHVLVEGGFSLIGLDSRRQISLGDLPQGS